MTTLTLQGTEIWQPRCHGTTEIVTSIVTKCRHGIVTNVLVKPSCSITCRTVPSSFLSDTWLEQEIVHTVYRLSISLKCNYNMMTSTSKSWISYVAIFRCMTDRNFLCVSTSLLVLVVTTSSPFHSSWLFLPRNCRKWDLKPVGYMDDSRDTNVQHLSDHARTSELWLEVIWPRDFQSM